MFFLFGSRSSKIREVDLKNTTCLYCETRNSFRVTTFGNYFHLFWVPLFPLHKTHVAECHHCKKTYTKDMFTPEMLKSLENENRLKPAKRPIWQGCGCLVLLVFFIIVMSLSFYGVYLRSQKNTVAKYDVNHHKIFLDGDVPKQIRIG